MFLTLYQDDFHRVEHHISSGGDRKRVACTFTPFNFYTIDNEGFGVSFLLARGYDVIAFKCINDSWFQQLPPSLIQAVGDITARYEDVVTYGSSMGGYAAIAFSKMLHADSIIAISPQFAINEPSDRRWAVQAEGITWQYKVESDQISARTMYLLYDDTMALEVQQVQKIANAAVSVGDIHHLKFPLSGHPTGTFLAQTGTITKIISDILAGRITGAPLMRWSQIRRSSAYFLSLSLLAKSKGRQKLELLTLRSAVRLRPDHVLVQNLLRDALTRAAITERGSGGMAQT